ncbi:MAG: alpha/beta hydrolase [Solirubrobacterales bacterium]|nr:alpha/beta hydrolase [Solirubrobacterales bacterium]
MSGSFEARQIDLHGHRAIYRITGEGPPVVLIHGMINSSRHWAKVADRLAVGHTVIAPDLIGHGDSSTPRGDYSLGAHASSIRDLLTAIGFEKASIAGHSLGGGVAMQFFYQFPQRTERLMLISSGGLGREVSPMLRGAALPGAGIGLAMAANRLVLGALGLTSWLFDRVGSDIARQTDAIARALKPLSPPGARRAFLETLRSVIDIRGQKVSATDRLHLLETTPTLIVWGERDNTIPMVHGADAHRAVPHSRFETLPRAAHFPNLEDPEGLATVIADFLAETASAAVPDEDWGRLVENDSAERS